MILIPLGHDRGVFRLPYVTFGVVLICFAVQVYSCVGTQSEAELMSLQQRELVLLEQAWADHGEAYAEELLGDPDHAPAESLAQVRAQIQQHVGLRREFLADYLAGKVVDQDDPGYLEYQRIQREKEANLGLLAYGYSPKGPAYTLITYAFIHGGWLHLIGNMLFLWLCGCNLEDRWGRLWWLGLYLGGGVAAAWAFAMVRHWDPSAPLVGASGAIAAAMGAFLVVHHSASIRMFYWFWFISGTFWMRAYWALPLWFLQQLLGVASESDAVPVAYSAHVGGFVFGVIFALAMKATKIDRRLTDSAVEQNTVYREHPLYVEAAELADAGNHEAARSRLQALLTEQSGHLGAVIDLARLTLEHGQDPAEASRLVGRAIVAVKRSGDKVTAQQLHADLRARFPDQRLDARALFALAEATEATDPVGAVALYRTLIAQQPDDVMVPKALLKTARLLAGPLSDADAARSVLEQIRQQFPASPYSDQADQALAALPTATFDH